MMQTDESRLKMTDGSALSVMMLMKAGRAQTCVRGHRRLLAGTNDENRLMSTKLLPVVDVKP
jgi:hypothetical protein